METVPLKKLLRECGVRSAELARRLKVDKATVCRWQKRVPAERVLEVERATGINRSDLRPDIYPRPKPRKSERAA